MEADFPKKVLAHARLKGRLPPVRHDQISSVLPSHNASTSSTRHFSSTFSHNASTFSSRPSTAPELDSVDSRYLSSARVWQTLPGSHSPREGACPRAFKTFPMRPGTAPEFESIDSACECIDLPAVMQIVESPTTFTITTPKGPLKIPSRNWLVLEPCALLQDTGCFAGRRLVEDLGGGAIPEEGTELVRLVTEDRLHVKAAEANFKRASRGTSVLTLRHAAYAMELLRCREREVETGAMVPLQSCPPSTEQIDSGLLARLHRLSRVVRNTAAAARTRPTNAELALMRKEEQALKVFRGPSLITRPQDRLLRGNALLHKGVHCLEEFHEFVLRRYGNTVRAWFLLDPEENMKIGERVFVRRVLDLGFKGNVTAMYKYVDSDRSGSISILELDSNAATILAGFKKFIDKYFKGCADACFQFMDRGRIGRLSRDDVVHCLEKLNFNDDWVGNYDELFDMLDRQGFGYVVPRDLTYLKKWKPRAYLFCKPDTEVLRQVKDGFCLVHGNMWRTWRFALDIDDTMRVSWEQFFMACKKLARQVHGKGLPHTLPTTEEDVGAAWRALDEDCSGWIALKEFDLPCFNALKNFRTWAVNEHGSCVQAMRKLDMNGNARLNTWELKKSDTRPNAYPGDVDTLFEYLDLDRQKSLGEPEVKFLDDWDIAWEEYEEVSKGRRRTTAIYSTSKTATLQDLP